MNHGGMWGNNLSVWIAVFGTFCLILGPNSNAQNQGELSFDLTTPSSTFNNIDDGGILDYSIDLGRVEVTSDLWLPVILNFRSDRTGKNPIFGAGWNCPLLESFIVRSSETEYVWRRIDGRQQAFYLEDNDRLHSVGRGWHGKIGSSVVALTGPKGDTYRFVGGRLQSISLKNGPEVKIELQQGQFSSLRAGDRPLIELYRSSQGKRRISRIFVATNGLADILGYFGL